MFINFGLRDLPKTNKYILDSLVFPRGNLVFLPGLVFFLGSTEQYKAMKIGITLFGSKLDLLCISKVLTIFCVFSKIRRKKKHSRGHVACSPSARDDLSVWALGTRGALGKYPGGVYRLGHSGHVAHSESTREGSIGSGTRDTWRAQATSGGTLPAWVLGTRVALGGFRGNIT